MCGVNTMLGDHHAHSPEQQAGNEILVGKIKITCCAICPASSLVPTDTDDFKTRCGFTRNDVDGSSIGEDCPLLVVGQLSGSEAAQMYALVAEMHAINASVEAMKVDNVEREARGEAVAWPYDCFNQAQNDLETIAKRLREEI